MKKTLIICSCLLAAMTAAAGTTTINPVTEEGWTMATGRDGRGQFTQDATTGTLTLVNSNWGQATASKSLTAITLSKTTDALSFSFDLDLQNSTNQCFSMTLLGDSKALTIGYTHYNNGKTTYTYAAPVGNGIYIGDNLGSVNPVNISTDKGVGQYAFSATIAWNADASEYQMSVTDGTNTLAGISMGADPISFNEVRFSGDGPNGITNGVISDVSIALTVADTPSVPEPTTATLSLLALAGLAARRRRK